MDEALRNKLDALIAMKLEEKLEKEEYLNILETLEEDMKHHDEEIRLKALGLIAESKKTTMKFLTKEFTLVILFLIWNLGEKIEYVPLIKKILKRWVDGLAVMKKEILQEEKMRNREKNVDMTSEIYEQALAASLSKCHEIEKDIVMYLQFSHSLHDMCVDHLYPDATYSRRKSCLKILCLMEEFLGQSTNFSWNSGKAETMFTCLLLDTYESNKAMAFKIIKLMDPALLNLDSEDQLCQMINTAIELGNSIRPIDSITAMYLFKVCLLSPKILDVIRIHFQAQEIFNQEISDPISSLILLILKRLETILTQARRNIVTTITKHSIYGYVFCIRGLLKDCDLRKTTANNPVWGRLCSKVIPVCFELNKAVSIIVNDSSPEGYLPLNLPIENDVITPQMVLLCSWRTVKEVSLLFGELVAQVLANDISDVEILTRQQIIDIGNHLVDLLRETKHRGAFEQTHVGLQQMCAGLWRTNREDLNELPSIWLYQILLEIVDLGQRSSKLCATRRSAGVPFMIQALIASAPNEQFNDETSISHSVMKVLLRITELKDDSNNSSSLRCLIHDNPVFSKIKIISQETEDNVENIPKVQENEIKTHALNVLRALFRHHRLEDFVKKYISNGLIVAMNSYNGKTWAERNAATMLFSALVIRIFGVQRTKDHVNLTTDNTMSGKLFFERYPKLLPYILNELTTFVSVEDNLEKTNVYPILLLLSRLYRNNHDQTDGWKIDELIKLISECAKSRVDYTRQLAARALMGLLNEQSASDLRKELMMKIVKDKNNLTSNQLHGYMLQLLKIAQKFQHKSIQLDNINVVGDFIIDTRWIFQSSTNDKSDSICFPFVTVYVNFLCEIFQRNQNMINTFEFSFVLSKFLNIWMGWDVFKFGPGKESYLIAAIDFIVSILRYDFWEKPNVLEVYMSILEDSDEQVQMRAWKSLPIVMEQVVSIKERKSFYAHTVDTVRSRIKSFHSYNPDLQDAILNFFYKSLVYGILDDSSYRLAICRLILVEMKQNDKNSSYERRCSFIRLLGKSYVIARTELQTKITVDKQCKNYIYNLYFDTWINEVDHDFRNSALEVMYDLFNVCKNIDRNNYFMLNWWTTVLKLLVDDNATTRHQVSQLISKIMPTRRVGCYTPMFHIFFYTFDRIMSNDYPGLAIVAFFYWSIAFSSKSDHTMDETDVFNKCTNHDSLEPTQISELCTELIDEIITEKNYSIDRTLPIDGIRWLNSVIDIDISGKTTFKQLINQYKSNIPNLKKPLQEILDPMYKDKLITYMCVDGISKIL